MSPEKKQRRKWGWQHRLRAGRALWTQSGWEAAELQGRDYSLRAAEPQAQPPTFTRVSKHLQMSHSAVRDTGTGTEEMQQWGTSTSQHPAITISTQHPWEQQSLASYLTKSAKIIIFERKKIWLSLSWLLGTWLEYTLENAELCHLCISAYGAKISNLILTINTVLFCFPE